MSNEDRMKIMEDLKSKKLEAVTHKCPTCQSPAYCAIQDGKSGSACWCMEAPVIDQMGIYEESECLCKNCLTTI